MTTFVTSDRRIGIVIGDDLRGRLLEHCSRAGRKETGGILIGHYTELHDVAVVTDVTGPPPDSIRRRFSFIRGLAGIQRLIDRAWAEDRYYLGEWHYHPFMPATPSDRDRQQIKDFSNDPAYACPEPILVVVGGDPGRDPQIYVAAVQQGELIALMPSDDVNDQVSKSAGVTDAVLPHDGGRK